MVVTSVLQSTMVPQSDINTKLGAVKSPLVKLITTVLFGPELKVYQAVGLVKAPPQLVNPPDGSPLLQPSTHTGSAALGMGITSASAQVPLVAQGGSPELSVKHISENVPAPSCELAIIR